MAVSENELQQEKEYLEKVKSVIEKKLDESKIDVDETKLSLQSEKRFMWENLSDYTDEERAAALYEMDIAVDNTNKQLDSIVRYEQALKSPYFAKLNFKYDDGSEYPIYIGITSVSEHLDFYVFDWRAPISSMFYNYEIGKAKYEIPNGEVTGEILSKMQFKIVDGNLLRCFKSNINIDDEYLQEILANASSEKMQNIVSTIQREQNEIIRNTLDRYLIVQGVAGSGKTSVALHRIAYLLYKDLNLTSNNILIFSPNDVFSDYISDVLPELGEKNVLKTTFSDFVRAYLKPHTNIESYTNFLERIYSTKKGDRKVIAYKLSEQYQEDIKNFYEEYVSTLKFTQGIKMKNAVISEQELSELFQIKYQKLPIKERIDEIVDHVCYTFHISKKKYAVAIKRTLLSISNISLDYYSLYQSFLESKYFDKFSSKDKLKGAIKFEDIIGLIYFYFEINGYPNYNYIRQVVIDEVQDYTKFQIDLLNKIFKNASFTILGDTNQTINPYYQYSNLNNLSSVFAKARYLELTKTYRSSEEIIDYTNRILGINNVCAVRKNNNMPVSVREVKPEQLNQFIETDIEMMFEDKIKRIAIITKSIKQAVKLNEMLQNCFYAEHIQLITDGASHAKKPIVIIPSYLSKGLEFDGVIAYNDLKDSYTEKDRNLYYVVCTRAQHKLNIYNDPLQSLTNL